MSRRLGVLALDDQEADVALLARHLCAWGFEPTIRRVASTAELAPALRDPDLRLVVCESAPPALDPLAALAEVQSSRPDVPVVLYCRDLPADAAAEAVRRGALDCVLKARPERLRASVEAVLGGSRPVPGAADDLPDAILDSLTAHVAVLDVHGDIIAVNEAWRRFAYGSGSGLLGFGPGTNYLEVCRSALATEPDDGALAALRGIEAVLAGDAPSFAMEYACAAPGAERWYQMVARPLRSARGGVVVAHEDITERWLAENELRRGRERYESFVRHSHEAVYCTEFDHPIDTSLPLEEQIDAIYANAYLGECNDAMAAMYGSTSEEFVGQRMVEVHGGKDVAANREMWRRFIAAGYRGAANLTEEIGADGRRVWYESSDTGVVEGGKLLRIWGVARDVTDRVEAEEAARTDLAVQRLRAVVLRLDSEADWPMVVTEFSREVRALVEFRTCSINLVDWDAGRVESHSHSESAGHYTVSRDFVHESLWRVHETGEPLLRPTRDDPLFDQATNAAIQCVLDVPFLGGTVAVNSEVANAFGAREIDVLRRFALVVSSGYQRVMDLAALRRRSEELEAENRQREGAEARQTALVEDLRAVLSTADELIAAPDHDTLCRRAVELARERLGVDRCALFLARPGSEELHATYGTDPRGATTDEHDFTIPVWSDWRELTSSRRLAEPRWQILRDVPLYFQGREAGRGDHAMALVQSGERVLGALFTDNLLTGEPLDEGRQEAMALYGSLLGNILERRRAEDTLRFSLQTSDDIVQTIPTGLSIYQWHGGRRFKLISANPASERLLGISSDACAGLDFEEIFPGVAVLGHLDLYHEVMRTGLPYQTDDLTYTDGRIAGAYRVSAFRLPGDRLAIAFEEITAHKQAEEALRASEERWQYALEGAGDGVWDWDIASSRVYFSDRWQQMLGYEPGTLTDDLEQWRVLVHPDDLSAVLEILLPHIDRELPEYRSEYRMVCADGSSKWILDRGKVISRDESGRALRMIGTHTDITERRQTEELLRARLELGEIAGTCTLDELLEACLDRAEALTGSDIAFFHFVDADQIHLTLQAWSSNTVASLCQAEAKGAHYPVDEAGVWVDCFHARAPVIHNDYAALPHRKGLPEGHARLVRQLVVPVIRDGLVTAMLGVGNKPADYTEEDVRLVSAVASFVMDVVDRRRAEDALRESEDRLLRTLDAAGVVAWSIDAATEDHHEAGPVGAVLGRPAMQRQPSVPDFAASIHPEDRDRVLGELSAALRGEAPYSTEYRVTQDDGSVRWVYANGALVRDAEGRPARLLGIARDITERRQSDAEREWLQSQLAQAQKMEAVGQLAGGIAHDFNNMLLVILGHVDLVLGDLPDDGGLRADLLEIRKAAQRSADLTRQLLAFARKQTASPRLLDLNETVGGMLSMLRRLIGEDIELAWHPGAALWSVRIDPAQIDQIMANFLVNARDAINGVGRIDIVTGNAVIDESHLGQFSDLLPGRYVSLRVTDTGCGMTSETLQRLFEPFYTTKAVGQGTGLGLATVYGIVRQNEGAIRVVSELGVGSTFTVYLPAHQVGADAPVNSPAQAPRGRGETLLLVEDDPAVLKLGQSMLRRLGYRVLTACDPYAGLELATEHAAEVALLLVDVVMPGMNGRELVAALADRGQAPPCLYLSGYTADVIARRGVLDEGVEFLQKPFTFGELAQKVRSVLDASVE